MATMLVFIVTDLAVPRAELRAILARVVAKTFNRISVDSDTSTSDTVALLSSCAKPCGDPAAFEKALHTVCEDLAEDVVRNGEGVRHVIRVRVSGATDEATAAALGKAVVNAPLFKCAVAGNDPNVGRLIQAIGKHAGAAVTPIDLRNMRARIGGMEIFGDGVFKLDREKEVALTAHFKDAELYASAPDAAGHFAVPVDFPRHERCVEIEVDLDTGDASATVLGADLTHEYVSENADYRS
jgi:glutamate N-acetyltransferase/amino-acid N-acetyltransferase